VGEFIAGLIVDFVLDLLGELFGRALRKAWRTLIVRPVRALIVRPVGRLLAGRRFRRELEARRRAPGPA